jgi:hypothetical protein
VRTEAFGVITAFAMVAGALASCRPSLDDRPWLIREPSIVGVKAEPPEAAPGDPVTMSVVTLGGGSVDTATASWSLCHLPKPVGENRVVDAACFTSPHTDAVGNPVILTVPFDACALFGPDTPQPAPGASPTRPRDPDTTGGYFQPTLVTVGTLQAVALERVTCDLLDASLAVARAFRSTYQVNHNPRIAGLSLSVEGARVTAELTWSAESVETFPFFDRENHQLVSTAESLSVSWYVTDGDLDQAGATINDGAVSTQTHWIVPQTSSSAEILAVLRDSRGGSDAARATITVLDSSNDI